MEANTSTCNCELPLHVCCLHSRLSALRHSLDALVFLCSSSFVRLSPSRAHAALHCSPLLTCTPLGF